MTKNCNTHGDYESIEMDLFNKVIWTGCPKCIEESERETVKRIDEKEQQEKAKKLTKLYEAATIPERFKHCTFETYTANTEPQRKALNTSVKYYTVFAKVKSTGAALFYCGKYGTGKTHLAVAILNALIQTGKGSGKYTTTLRMIRDIRSSYRGGNFSEQQLIDKYVNYPLLILDEVGVQFGTDGEKILLFEVINGRYENYKPSIIISNLSMKGITEYLGERAIDRLKSKAGALVVMDWESWRGKE